MNREEFIHICKDYAELRQCQFNPDEKHLSFVFDGVMKKQEQTGLRYCPCRLGDSWDYLCPCDFEIQETWKEKGMCWCGLFVKR